MVYFARYDSKAIKVNRKRKRAIAKQAAKTRSKVIEVGDVVEVVDNSMFGFDNGSVVYVVCKDEMGDWLLSTSLKENSPYSLRTRWHQKTDIKLIKKGTKQLNHTEYL